MRDPFEIPQIDFRHEKYSVLEINELPEYDLQDYDLLDQKDFAKYIKDMETLIRRSFEYRQLISFLRDNMDMNKCSFYENVNNIDTYKIKIHLHHHPFTLYDICIMVYNKRMFHGESLEIEMVAKEVMFLHYKLLVGLIPLSETVHELVHNNYLFIPLDKVLGNYKKFIELYEDFMTPEQLDLLERNIQYSETFIEEKNMNILSKNYIYVDMTGVYDIPTMTSVIDMMDKKIKQIKNKDIEVVKNNLKPLFVKCEE